MGWDAMMFGDLRFPPGSVEAWKELVIEDGLFKESAWKKSHWMGDPGETTTVAGLIAKLEDHARWCEKTYKGPDHVSLVVDGDEVSFRAYINEDDFRHWCGLVATMFRVGAKVGAIGEYVAIANDDLGGERLVLEEGGSRVEEFDAVGMMTGEADGSESSLDYQTIIDELMKTMGEKIERMTKPKTGGAAAPKKKAAAKKAAAKKAAPKKAAPKKAAPKKAAPKKPAAPKKNAKKK